MIIKDIMKRSNIGRHGNLFHNANDVYSAIFKLGIINQASQKEWIETRCMVRESPAPG